MSIRVLFSFCCGFFDLFLDLLSACCLRCLNIIGRGDLGWPRIVL